MRMKWLIAVGMLLGCGLATASTFFPEEGTGYTEKVAAILESLPADGDYIYIDDMIFRIDDVLLDGFTGTRWTDGEVYVEFAPDVTPAHQTTWMSAAAMWEDVARLEFIPRTFEFNYIYVVNSTENSSQVGMVGGPQVMRINNWTESTIAHEIGHALGMTHEHQRYDRAAYVMVHYDNIEPDEYHNFYIEWGSEWYYDYDFDSLMHYRQCAWNLYPCPPNLTIECMPDYAIYQTTMGDATEPSERDEMGMAARYGAPYHGPIYVDSAVAPGYPIQNGSEAYPYWHLEVALNVAESGAEIRIVAGTYDYAPITLDQPVLVRSYGGTVLIQ